MSPSKKLITRVCISTGSRIVKIIPFKQTKRLVVINKFGKNTISLPSKYFKMPFILRLLLLWSLIARQNVFFCKADQQFDQQSLEDFMSACIHQHMGK